VRGAAELGRGRGNEGIELDRKAEQGAELGRRKQPAAGQPERAGVRQITFSF